MDEQTKKAIKNYHKTFKSIVRTKKKELEVFEKLFEKEHYKKFQTQKSQWENFASLRLATNLHLITEEYEMKYIYNRKQQETEKQIVKVLQSDWRKKERNLKDENEQARLFNTVFERYVNEAKMEYPEGDVEREIEKIYMEELADLPDEVVREQATKRWPFQWPLDYLSRLAQRNSVALSQESMRDVANILENEVMQRLSKIQFFDADFIISCIQMTKKVLEEKGIDKN